MKAIKAQTLEAIVAVAGATLVAGTGKTWIRSVAPLATAGVDALSFYDAETMTLSQLRETKAGAVIVAEPFLADCPVPALVCATPKLAFARVLATLLYKEKVPPTGLHPSAVIGPGVLIGPGVSIGPGCVVGENAELQEGVVLGAHVVVGAFAKIGARTRISAHVVLYTDVHVGTDCLIHSGAILGSDGFGYVNDTGRWLKIPQVGGLRIGNFVEIGANTTIDCGALQDTVIEDGVILDNQIQIAHNVHIGAHTAIAGCVGIAGSTRIGKYCLIGGGSCIAGHLTIGDQVHIAGMSGVSRSIVKPGIYSSSISVRPHQIWKKNVARLHHLDELATRLRQVEHKMREVEKR